MFSPVSYHAPWLERSSVPSLFSLVQIFAKKAWTSVRVGTTSLANIRRGYKREGGRKPTYLTSATSILTSVKAVSVVPSDGTKTDVHKESTDVRWVGFYPLQNRHNTDKRVIPTLRQRRRQKGLQHWHLLHIGYQLWILLEVKDEVLENGSLLGPAAHGQMVEPG